MVRAPSHRRVRAVGSGCTAACDARLDFGRIGCRGVFRWNALLIHREPDQLVAGLVLRTTVAAGHRLALVKTECQHERVEESISSVHSAGNRARKQTYDPAENGAATESGLTLMPTRADESLCASAPCGGMNVRSASANGRLNFILITELTNAHGATLAAG